MSDVAELSPRCFLLGDNRGGAIYVTGGCLFAVGHNAQRVCGHACGYTSAGGITCLISRLHRIRRNPLRRGACTPTRCRSLRASSAQCAKRRRHPRDYVHQTAVYRIDSTCMCILYVGVSHVSSSPSQGHNGRLPGSPHCCCCSARVDVGAYQWLGPEGQLARRALFLRRPLACMIYWTGRARR